jgi:tetratricopeptide (TPR) repeat protein
MAEGIGWQALWSSASAERTAGRISRAQRLFQATVAASPPAAEPYAESGLLNLEIVRSLTHLGALYEAHCRTLGLAAESCDAWTQQKAFVDETLASAVDHLLRAADMAMGQAAWQAALADAIALAGRERMALPYRRRAARIDPGEPAAMIAIGRALAALGDHGQAADHYQELARRWPSNPGIRLRLIHASVRAGREQDAAGRYASLLRHAPDGESDRVGDLLALTRTAAELAPELPGSLCGELFDAASGLAEQHPDDYRAHLAAGFAALGAANRPIATARFASATALFLESPHPEAPDKSAADALAFASAFLCDPSLTPQPEPQAVAVDGRFISLAIAREAGARGDTFQMLRRYGEAMGGFVVASIPLRYELYKQYKIVQHERMYYAIPGHVYGFRIVDGVVCRIPVNVQQARVVLPRWVTTLADRLLGIARAIDPHGRVLAPVRRLARRFGLMLYAVPGVAVADSREALKALIDRSPVPSAKAAG